MRITNPSVKAFVSGIEQYRRPVDRTLDALAPSNGHKRVRYIDNRMARALVEELAPKVRDAMPGFRLDTSRLDIRVQSRTQASTCDRPLPFDRFTPEQSKEFWERIERPIPTYKRATRWFRNGYRATRNGLHNHIDKRLVLACYRPDEKQIVLAGKAVRALSWNALRSTIFHELVHAAQDQTYPMLMRRMDDEIDQEVVRLMVNPKRKFRMDLVRGRKTLLEGHARFLDRQFAKTLPEGRTSFRRLRNGFYGRATNLFADFRRTHACYVEGFNFFQEVQDELIPKELVREAYWDAGVAERYLSSPQRLVDARYWTLDATLPLSGSCPSTWRTNPNRLS